MWGKPAESVATAEGSVLAFDIDPFQAVEVLIGERRAWCRRSRSRWRAPLDPKQLAEQLSLSDIRPVTAMDEADQPLGQAFPERGVIFMFQASDSDALAADGEMPPSVSHVVLQRLDPLAFAMRAEECLHGPYTQNIKDLEDRHRARSEVRSRALPVGEDLSGDRSGRPGRRAAALRRARSIRTMRSYQLLHGRTQELLGEYDNAVLTVRAVLDRENISDHRHVPKRCIKWARLASLGDVEIASKAIGFHTRAIEIADTLADERDQQGTPRGEADSGRSAHGGRRGNRPPGVQSEG